MTGVNDTIAQDDRAYASDVAGWIERAQAEARRTGTIDTRSLVQSIDIIVKALRAYSPDTAAVPVVRASEKEVLCACEDSCGLKTALETIRDCFWTDGETYAERLADLKTIARDALSSGQPQGAGG